MSYRRDAAYRYGNRRAEVLETENYVHETIMYLVSILDAEETVSMELTKLTVELCKRGNTKPLKKISIGDSVEDRVLAFAWQHPTIFNTTINDNNRIISLRSMNPDIDDELENKLEDRLVEFLVFRCNQYGPCQIPISKLLGNLYQAANDIRLYFNNDYLRFHHFLRTRSDIFTLIDPETVALKTAHDQAILKNTSLLKCDEYYLDERVLNCTRMVDRFSDGLQIIRGILNTKNLVAIDCEGVNLGAPNGYITLVQLAIVDDLPENHTDEDVVNAIRIFLFDVQEDDRLMCIALKKLLKATKITKIFQGCSSDATALYNRYKIVTDSVFDTVIAHRHLNEGAKSDLYYLYEYYVGEGTNRMKKDIKKKYISNPRLWTTRPLNELLTYYAAFDVFALIRIYYKLKEKIDTKTYDEIFEKSSVTAQSAYRRSLPLYGIQLYAKGYTMAQVHAEIGWPLDSDDEIETNQESSTTTATTNRPKTTNGRSNYQTNKYQRNYNRSQDETVGVGSSSTSGYHHHHHHNNDRTTSNYDNNKHRNGYYNGNALYRTSYNPTYRPNQFGTKSDRTQRPTLLQNNHYQRQQQQSTNPYDTTQQQHHQQQYQQLQQPQQNYYHYQQPYQYQYQANYQFQNHYQPNHHQYHHPQQQQYHLNSYQFQQQQQPQQHQQQQTHPHQQDDQQATQQQPHHQQQQHYQNRHQHYNSRRNLPN